jgi:predicted PP-loop superfamily ATPase
MTEQIYNLRELQDIYEGYKNDGRTHICQLCVNDISKSNCPSFQRIIGKVEALELLIRNKNGGSLVL